MGKLKGSDMHHDDAARELHAYARQTATDTGDSYTTTVRHMLDATDTVSAEIGCTKRQVHDWCIGKQQVQLIFGCSDPTLGYDAWQKVFTDLATHLKASVNENLYGDDWVEADEGCSLTADTQRIDAVRQAIATFDGPVHVY